MTDYQNLSESELQAVIESAEKALKNIQANKRKDVIAQIKELGHLLMPLSTYTKMIKS